MNFVNNILKYVYNYFYKQPFYENIDFVEWALSSKVVVIVRGPRGSKNRSLIDELSKMDEYCAVISKDGCDGDGGSDGHVFLESLQSCKSSKKNLIIVSLPSLDYSSVKPFLEYAHQYYYMTILTDFMGLWKYDLEESLRTSCREQDIQSELDKFQGVPVYFAGWFMSDDDQQYLHKLGRECLAEMLSDESLRNQLKKESHTDDVYNYYPQQQKRLHVTSKFIGRELNNEYVENMRGELCTMSDMIVRGLLLTPRTYSCHVELSSKAQAMFGEQDLVKLKPHITLAVGGPYKPVESGPDQVKVQTLIRNGVAPTRSFEVTKGTVDDYGQCLFYLTLNEEKHFKNLFNFFY